MQQPNNVSLDEWQVYADYCFDYNLNEQRARNIIKAIQNNKTKLWLYYETSNDRSLLSAMHYGMSMHVLGDKLVYFWSKTPAENKEGITSFHSYFDNYPQIKQSYFEELGKDESTK